jgi:hypothetical protein
VKLVGSFLKTYFVPLLSIFFLSTFGAIICVAEEGAPQTTGQAAADDPQKVFAKLDNYLKTNAIEFTTSYDAQNVSIGASRGQAHFYIEHPNLLRIELSGNGFSYLMISDGKLLTIYDEKAKRYAQRPASERPIEAVNLFTGLAAFQARVLQFLGVAGDVARGNNGVKVTKVGVDRIGGLACVRYAIQYTSEADSDKWTAWLREDGVPLPCKTFIRSSDEGSQQTNLYNWGKAVSQSANYVFAPPAGSTKVSISDLDLRPLQ